MKNKMVHSYMIAAMIILSLFTLMFTSLVDTAKARICQNNRLHLF